MPTDFLQKTIVPILAAAFVVVGFAGTAEAQEMMVPQDTTLKDEIYSEPPAGGDYRKVSELTELPEFVPGLGTLYVEPANLPQGPYLAYGENGELVATVYMISQEKLQGGENFENLRAFNFETDHLAVTYNPGHAGFEEPHYHVVAWYVPVERQRQLARGESRE